VLAVSAFNQAARVAGAFSTVASVVGAIVWAQKHPAMKRFPAWYWSLLILGSVLLTLGNQGYVRGLFLFVTGGVVVLAFLQTRHRLWEALGRPPVAPPAPARDPIPVWVRHVESFAEEHMIELIEVTLGGYIDSAELDKRPTPSITFDVQVRNRLVFPVLIEQGVAGKVQMDGNDLHYALDLRAREGETLVDPLPYGATRNLRLKQVLNLDEAKYVRDKGQEAKFWLGNVRIFILRADGGMNRQDICPGYQVLHVTFP
jgi:hypothetical protein